jgi:hypothetical protein
MMVRLLLANRFPLLLWWSPYYCQLYNDPYRPVLGDKHPASMSTIYRPIGPTRLEPFVGLSHIGFGRLICAGSSRVSL